MPRVDQTVSGIAILNLENIGNVAQVAKCGAGCVYERSRDVDAVPLLFVTYLRPQHMPKLPSSLVVLRLHA